MKLSVSAYTAQASAHKNLCSYQHQRSYGATNQASTARTPSDLATVLPALKVRKFTPTFHYVSSELPNWLHDLFIAISNRPLCCTTVNKFNYTDIFDNIRTLIIIRSLLCSTSHQECFEYLGERLGSAVLSIFIISVVPRTSQHDLCWSFRPLERGLRQ